MLKSFLVRSAVAAAILAAASPAAAADIEVNVGTDWKAVGSTPVSGWKDGLAYDDSSWTNAVQSVVVSGTPYYWAPSSTTAYFRHIFSITGTVTSAFFDGAVDDDAAIWINGTQVYNDTNGLANFFSLDVSSYLQSGDNLIAVRTLDTGGNRGFGGTLAINVAAAVPEPGTWAMMIGGFGLVGAGMRRRKMVAATA